MKKKNIHPAILRRTFFGVGCHFWQLFLYVGHTKDSTPRRGVESKIFSFFFLKFHLVKMKISKILISGRYG
jgi:hypothetical protein